MARIYHRTHNSYLGRRRFLQMTGLGSLGLVGAMLVGCSDDDGGDDGDSGGAVGTSTSGAGAATSTAEGTGTASGGSGGGDIGSVDVLGIWGDVELDNFRAMVAPWEDETGGSVDFTGNRGVAAVLTTRVEGGNPPDIAIPAAVGLFRQFATDGRLASLADLGVEETVTGNYPQGFLDLGTVDGTLYGFFMKADTKGTIWYSPRVFDENGWEPLTADSTWEDLIALSEQIRDAGMAPWSIGVSSEADSGWPGTDWIQQILLNVHGPDVYDGIVDGSIPFTDERMRDSWEKFGQIALTEGFTAQGGATGINATGFQEATYPPFEPEPGAAMTYLGGFASGFITDQFPDLVAEEDYDFFPFPGGAITGGANIAYAFNADDGTASLMQYLAGAEGQSIWVEAGGFTSVNGEVSLDSYPDPIARAQAEQLSNAEVFRFDLDDAIGGELQAAFFTGVTQYLADPSQLDAILESIEATRA